jgi:hypothetical protein
LELHASTGERGRSEAIQLSPPKEQASLTLTEVPSGGAFFTEGSVSYVVPRQGFRTVLRKAIEKALPYQPLIAGAALDPGAYELVSYRPCDGSCSALDPPKARCSRPIALEAGERVVVTVKVHVPDRCSIRVRRAAEIGRTYPFRLRTRCGIQNIFFDGRIWIPTGATSGVPQIPMHWMIPSEAGEIRLTSPNTLEFTAWSGGTVRFEAPTRKRDPSLSECN